MTFAFLCGVTFDKAITGDPCFAFVVTNSIYWFGDKGVVFCGKLNNCVFCVLSAKEIILGSIEDIVLDEMFGCCN